jgi:DNA invertase Pin-like site-specific DNA recombinase
VAKRKAADRGLFYTRDSGGRHETTPGEYVLWGRRAAAEHGLTFDGTPARIEAMIRDGRFRDGDLFLDFGVTGNKLSRAGIDALIEEALKDQRVSHILIPRRDRLARPDDPIDGMRLERRLREAGLTLVFMDRIVRPLKKGRRADLGEMIATMVDYDHAGEFRRDLAQKMIHAQTALAKAGYSTGGRPPYGFRRWLVRLDGSTVRQLAEGEYVRMAGHHVAWLPGPEEELAVIRRILAMLERMPASRVAATLTAEGVPAPDADRRRTDRGVNHPTSGVWHQPTILNIARNPLLLAVVSYGRRSMGDQLRFSPDGPRPLEEDDRRADGQPKVVANPETDRIRVEASFHPSSRPLARLASSRPWRPGPGPSAASRARATRRATRWALASSTWPAGGRSTASPITGRSATCAGSTSRATGRAAATITSTARRRPDSS